MNELEWHKMKELVDDYADTVDRFEKEIQAFIEEIRPAINV
jgi:hypothetical protein